MKYFSEFYREILNEEICNDKKISGRRDIHNPGNIRMD